MLILQVNLLACLCMLSSLCLASNRDILSKPGYLAFQVNNETQIIEDHEVFIVVKGINPKTGRHTLIKFDNDGVGSYYDVDANTIAKAYSYPLSLFSSSTLYLPKLISGRLYFSMEVPMQLSIVRNDKGAVTITDPDPFNPTDINYYTLYDKVEFTYTDDATWTNPTAVDFFSIPIHLEQDNKNGFTKTGFSQPRSEIMQEIIKTFTNESSGASQQAWQKLPIYFQDSLLRIVAPGKAYYSNNYPGNFDLNYLQQADANYIDMVWDYYDKAKHPKHILKVDCSEIQAGLCSGQVENDIFKFTASNSDETTEFTKPKSSIVFFAGSGDSFVAQKDTIKSIIIRNMTAAFEVGLLPNADGAVLSRDYFKQQHSNFYQENPVYQDYGLDNKGPWYDLYAKALHQFADQPIYAFAYDDVLGQDGTLVNQYKLRKLSAPSPVILTLGDMSGTKIVDPFDDQNTYTVTPYLASSTKLFYNGKAVTSGETITDLNSPWIVNLNGVETKIYFATKLVLPSNQKTAGVVIQPLNSAGDQINIQFPPS